MPAQIQGNHVMGVAQVTEHLPAPCGGALRETMNEQDRPSGGFSALDHGDGQPVGRLNRRRYQPLQSLGLSREREHCGHGGHSRHQDRTLHGKPLLSAPSTTSKVIGIGEWTVPAGA